MTVIVPSNMNVMVLPETIVVRRGWRERLFTLPWVPLVTHKEIQNPDAPAHGVIVQAGLTLYGTSRTLTEAQTRSADIANFIEGENPDTLH